MWMNIIWRVILLEECICLIIRVTIAESFLCINTFLKLATFHLLLYALGTC